MSSINWIKMDTIEVDFIPLELFRSDDNQYLKFLYVDSFKYVNAYAKGTFISVRLEDGGRRYFASSVSTNPHEKPFNIYASNPSIDESGDF